MGNRTIKEIHLKTNITLESITPLKSGKVPTVMTVAGSDSSGGAGIEADIKTITEHHCYALTAISTLTAQNTTGVKDVISTTGSMIGNILDENFADIQIDSIKTGLLTDVSIPELKKAIVKYSYNGNLVVDPVMVSTSGFDFVSSNFLNLLIGTLSPYITVITPNLIEAKAIINTLSGKKVYDENPLATLDDMFTMCKSIYDLTGIKNILVKGGHQKWGYDEHLLTDILYVSDTNTYVTFYSEMQTSKNTHGTGCTLSSAIASNLASGLSMINSIANGIVYVQQGIKTAPSLGHGHGPLNHIQNFQKFNYETLIQDGFVLPFPKGKALEFLCNHSQIKKYWQEYTNHEFMKQVKNFQLPFSKFTEFVEQNVVYLRNYAHIILYMGTKLSNEDDLFIEGDRLKTISTEIKKYKTILKKLGYSDEKINNITPSPVCQEYIDSLLNIAKDCGDLFDISLSLAPCFHGYYIACVNASKLNHIIDCENDLQKEIFEDWIEQNLSDWYKTACEDSEVQLNRTFEKNCLSNIKLQRAIEIFKMFTILEIKFLDEYL